MKYFALYFIGIISTLSCTARGELRVWTDNNGKTIEAEHVRTFTDTVILRQPNGSEIRISLASLSERDRRYAILQTPPRIGISVASITDRSNTGYGNRRSALLQEESISVEVKIRKSSSAPYGAPLRAEIYLIGSTKSEDRYIILGKETEIFHFSAENENQYVFQSSGIKLRQIESGRQMGVEYKGYLVAIIDESNEVLQLKCSKLDYEKNASAIIGSIKGTLFDDQFEEVSQREEMRTSSHNIEQKPFADRRF